jgi:flagellar hook-length control protein FliK
MIGKKMKVGAMVFGLALGGGALAGSVLGAPGISSAATSATTAVAVDGSSTAATTDTPAPPAAPAPETALDGDVAAQVTAAAQAAIPDGTIDRVETDNDGVYEAHVTKADGTHVVVQIGADYTVTATLDQPLGGPGGPGRHGGPGAGEAPLEGDTATSVTAAAQAAVPDGTVDRVETDSDGSPYEAHVTQADGTQVVVKVDASFAVTGIEDMPAGGPQGGHHGPPPAGSTAPADTSGTATTVAG